MYLSRLLYLPAELQSYEMNLFLVEIFLGSVVNVVCCFFVTTVTRMMPDIGRLRYVTTHSSMMFFLRYHCDQNDAGDWKVKACYHSL